MAFLESPAHPWSVSELAEVAGMSRSAFAAQFQKMMGETPLACLNRLRLEEAAAKLKTAGTSTADVGASVGFRSENGFIRAFQRRFGLSPSAWRSRADVGRLRDMAGLPT